jgi:ABC-2 type transport system ATP-binding protein
MDASTAQATIRRRHVTTQPRHTGTRQRAAIDARGLTKRFGHTLAVDHLSFHVPEGSITGFVGPNGSGKTTTMRMLMHLTRPDAGQARVLGASIDQPPRFLPRVGALIEAPAFEPRLSGSKNLRMLARLGRIDPKRIPGLLRLVGLGDAGKKPFKDYSLGMKQRLGIAAALLPDPMLLILDEPTNGLDPAGIREVRDLLKRLAAAGKTVFVSSHLIDELQRICTHLVVIDKGRLLYEGPVGGLLANGRGDLEETVMTLIGGRA